MREIKFRGRGAPRGKQWFYGDLDTHTSGVCILDNDTLHTVISETVGQFTSQTDNNGKDIYEGDILRVGSQIGTVIYDCDCFEVAFVGGNTSLFRCLLEKPCVVIGNVHDSPELLEGKDA